MSAAREAVIEGSQLRTLADAYDALKQALALPAHFGANLDALADSLSADMAGPVTLTWKDAAASEATLGPRFARLLAVLREAERERRDFRLILR